MKDFLQEHEQTANEIHSIKRGDGTQDSRPPMPIQRQQTSFQLQREDSFADIKYENHMQ
jgi:hypothetical protein